MRLIQVAKRIVDTAAYAIEHDHEGSAIFLTMPNGTILSDEAVYRELEKGA